MSNTQTIAAVASATFDTHAEAEAYSSRITALLRAVREAALERLDVYGMEAADADESLEYRRGVADAAAVIEEYLGHLEHKAAS